MRCRSGKIRYKDELGAKIALASRAARDKGEKRYYTCNLCNGYHLTSQDQKTEVIDPPGN